MKKNQSFFFLFSQQTSRISFYEKFPVITELTSYSSYDNILNYCLNSKNNLNIICKHVDYYSKDQQYCANYDNLIDLMRKKFWVA